MSAAGSEALLALKAALVAALKRHNIRGFFPSVRRAHPALDRTH
jgi:hypothetical protein